MPPYPQRPPEADLAPLTGPFDAGDAPADAVPRLDLGSVRMPLPDGARLQVEADRNGGSIRAVHVLVAQGQLTVNAFAAPRSSRLWNEVRRELITQLESGGARVRELDGPWGREVVASRPDLVLHFIGVNGPRWLLRGVAAGAPAAAAELVGRLRDMLRQAVVVRGDEPMPVRAALPLTLPEALVERLKDVTGDDVCS